MARRRGTRPRSLRLYSPITHADPFCEEQTRSTYGNQYQMHARYVMRDGKFYVDDPVWGSYTFEHPLFIRLANHPLFRRLQDIEQLSLPPQYETIAQAGFSRWEHIWGSAIFVYLMAQRLGISDHDTLVMALRTLLSDVGHRAGSHLADHLFQSFTGPEDLHDRTLMDLFERIGLNDILREFGINPVEVVMPDDADDWVECGQPRLCVDRGDFTQREGKRWIPSMELFYIDADSFTVVDNHLVMTNPQQAWVFGRAHLELSREHWSEPIHRLIEVLYVEMMKRAFVTGAGWDHSFNRWHPYDVMLFTDNDQLWRMQEHDGLQQLFGRMLKELAHYERTVGWESRSDRLNERLGQGGSFWRYPYPKHHHSVHVEEVKGVEREALTMEGNTLTVALPPFKWRHTDPDVLVDGEVVPLTQLDPEYVGVLEEHKRDMAMGHVAHLTIGNPEAARLIRDALTENAEVWPRLLNRPYMGPRELQEHVHRAGLVAGGRTRVEFMPD